MKKRKKLRKRSTQHHVINYFKIYDFIIEDNYKLTTLEGKKTHIFYYSIPKFTQIIIDQIAIIYIDN